MPFSRSSPYVYCLVTCLALYAELSVATTSEYQAKLAEFSEDLPQKSIMSIMQARDGSIWIGTQEGLHNYTGSRLASYFHDTVEQTSIGSGFITSLAQTSDGSVWIGTRGGGLNRYDKSTDRFTRFDAIAPKYAESESLYEVFSLLSDTNDRLWIGHDGAISLLGDDGLLTRLIDQRSSSLKLGLVNGFAETSSGVWAVAAEAGLIKLSTDGRILERMSQYNLFGATDLNAQPIGIMTDSEGLLWVWSINAGIVLINPDSKEIIKRFLFDERLPNEDRQVLDVLEYSPGKFWLATGGGLRKLDLADGEIRSIVSELDALVSPIALSLTSTSDGTIWIGTIFGLAKATPKMFDGLDTTNSGLRNDQVNTITTSTDGGLWVGTDDGLHLLSAEGSLKLLINDLTTPAIADASVMSLLNEPKGLWIGTFSQGLYFYSKESGEMSHFRHDPQDPKTLGSSGITSIARTKSGALLVGTYRGGLNKVDQSTGTVTRYQHSEEDSSSISNDNVIAIYQDSVGTIFIGTEDGLNVYDPITETFERYYVERGRPDSLSSNLTWSFFEDSDGDLWIGTFSGGVNVWKYENRVNRESEFSHYGNNIGLPSTNVNAMAEDQDGSIWLSHNAGLTKFVKETETARHFGSRDGLQSGEFNVNSVATLPNGRILFGGAQGLNIVNPQRISSADRPPNVGIYQVRVMNQPVVLEYQKTDNVLLLDLGHQDDLVEVDFFSDAYSAPSENTYGYRLSGITDRWVTGRDKHQASFTTLPPGKYTLELAAASPTGVWNWDAAQIRINVAPPPWLSGYAYTIYLIAATLFMIAVWRRSRLKTIRAEQARLELENKVRERTEQLELARLDAETANKAKSQFLATVSHEIRTPMHGIIGMSDLLLGSGLTATQNRYASAVKASGASLLEIINDILDYSKLEASKVELEEVEFSLNDEISASCALLAHTAASKGLVLTAKIAENLEHLVIADKKKLLQTVTNLVGNSLKFTSAGFITVSIDVYSCDGNRFEVGIIVKDTGIGISPEAQGKVFEKFTQADASTTRKYGGTGLGLSITKQYIELMGGTIDLRSELGVGTTIALRVPVTQGPKLQRARSALEGKRTLICDERAQVRESISSFVHYLGGDASAVASLAEEDLGRYVETTDIVFLDSSHNTGSFDDQDVAIITYTFETQSETERTSIFLPADVQSFDTLCFHALSENRMDSFQLRGDGCYETSNLQGGLNRRPKHLEVLIAEDVPVNQEIVASMLSQLEISYEIVSNGREAFETYKQNVPDLIFMDCQMPVIDGYTATQLIRDFEVEQGLSRTPIVALSAGGSEEERKLCEAAGMDDFVPKPFTLTDISEALEKWTQGSSRHKSTANDLWELPAQTNTAASSIDVGTLSQLAKLNRSSNGELAPKLLSSFEQQINGKLDELRSTDAACNPVHIRSIVHAIKSMSANMGAKHISEYFGELEARAKLGRRFNVELAETFGREATRTFLIDAQLFFQDEAALKEDT
jgi:signal transduction histidine kinase/ligand-binding sensor domain-containing protein/CheY-like chemotaxis protein/HPt (histidine-containing phosphotransfer) domain-containing protein